MLFSNIRFKPIDLLVSQFCACQRLGLGLTWCCLWLNVLLVHGCVSVLDWLGWATDLCISTYWSVSSCILASNGDRPDECLQWSPSRWVPKLSVGTHKRFRILTSTTSSRVTNPSGSWSSPGLFDTRSIWLRPLWKLLMSQVIPKRRLEKELTSSSLHHQLTHIGGLTFNQSQIWRTLR
jgi:hypothetical protein